MLSCCAPHQQKGFPKRIAREISDHFIRRVPQQESFRQTLFLSSMHDHHIAALRQDPRPDDAQSSVPVVNPHRAMPYAPSPRAKIH